LEKRSTAKATFFQGRLFAEKVKPNFIEKTGEMPFSPVYAKRIH
jgi:hypothetical protein